MSLPTAPEDRNLPKGPNFLAIVIGFAVAILVILIGSWIYLSHRKSLVPLDTRGTPSQTYVHPLPVTPERAGTGYASQSV